MSYILRRNTGRDFIDIKLVPDDLKMPVQGSELKKAAPLLPPRQNLTTQQEIKIKAEVIATLIQSDPAEVEKRVREGLAADLVERRERGAQGHLEKQVELKPRP